MSKLIKFDKSAEIVDVIKKIKTLKEDEAIFEFPKDAKLFKVSHNLVLIKKTGDVLGKTIMVHTDDLTGKMLVTKAGLLLQEGSISPEIIKEKLATKVTRKVKFSDIGAPRPIAKINTPSAATVVAKPREKDLIPGVKKYIPEVANISLIRKAGLTFSKVFVLVTIILVLAVFGLAVLLPQAQITVYARSEPITRDFEVTVDQGTRTINSGKMLVPAEAIGKEVSHTKSFPATGVKVTGTKATGSVTLYNFTKNTLTLRAATTTLLVNGKKYFFTKDVTGLRPTARIGTGADTEIDESSLIPAVPVIAEQLGQEYNIGTSIRLELSNSALGQADVYAITSGAMSGGTSVQTKIVAQQDLDKAVVTMTDELAAIAEGELSKDSDSKLKILSNAVNKEVLAKTANKNAGEEAETFDMTMIARVSGLAFKEEDVKNLVVEKINSVLSEDKYLLQDGKQDLNTVFKTVDIAKGTGVLSVHYETVAAYNVDDNNLSKILAGKNASEIEDILLTKPEIDRVDIQFSPFFVNKAPRFNGKIYIKTVLSQI